MYECISENKAWTCSAVLSGAVTLTVAEGVVCHDVRDGVLACHQLRLRRVEIFHSVPEGGVTKIRVLNTRVAAPNGLSRWRRIVMLFTTPKVLAPPPLSARIEISVQEVKVTRPLDRYGRVTFRRQWRRIE